MKRIAKIEKSKGECVCVCASCPSGDRDTYMFNIQSYNLNRGTYAKRIGNPCRYTLVKDPTVFNYWYTTNTVNSTVLDIHQ